MNKYSNSYFGFSVQKCIYQNLGGGTEYNQEIENAYGNTVGWRKSSWIDYSNFTFNLTAPKAHLPVCYLRRGTLGVFFHRINVCYLSNSKSELKNRNSLVS